MSQPNNRQETTQQQGIIDQFITALERQPMDIDEVQDLLRSINPDNVNTPSASGQLALLVATTIGNGVLIQDLLAKGANIQAAESSTGDTALHKAARAGKQPVVALLLRKGANASQRNASGQTASDIAAIISNARPAALPAYSARQSFSAPVPTPIAAEVKKIPGEKKHAPPDSPEDPDASLRHQR